MSKIEISIVVPLYNEEENFQILYESISEVMKQIGKFYEILFVDDGSSDHTFELAKGIHLKDKHVKVVKFRKNYGQTPAMQAGFDYAKGDLVISMDGDLQNDPKDIPKIMEKINDGYDIVCGWRKNRKDKLISRKIPSKIANWLIGHITGVKIHDNGCSLKAYKSSVLQRTRLYSEMHRFIPAMASITGIRYTEMVVNHHARQFGVSKYGISRVWRVILDLFLVKMLVSFVSRPAIWFGFLSLPFLTIGFIFSILSGYLYLNPSPSSQTAIIFPSVAFMFFFLFFHLFFLGFLSEFILKLGDFRQSDRINIESLDIL